MLWSSHWMEPHGQARACTPECHDQLFSPQKFRHTGVVPQNHTHLRQGFGGSSAGERNPPKHDRLIAEMVYYALTDSSTAKAVISCVGGWRSGLLPISRCFSEPSFL
jgi:hypothetical protein